MNNKINIFSTPILEVGYDWILFGIEIEEVIDKLDLRYINNIRDNVGFSISNIFKYGDFTYKKFKIGFEWDDSNKFLFESLIYKDELLEMKFRDNKLIEIYLGNGWKGNVLGFHIGDVLYPKIRGMNLIFDEHEDEFHVQNKNGEIIICIAIWTKEICSLEIVKNQKIKTIKIYKRGGIYCEV